ncbi:MAG: HupE/UreJ family protein, partial [Candidatus Binatia bacterium]
MLYVGLGIVHILSGSDHLAFLFALLLLARSLGEVATLASGFTIAHSVTLALAVFGAVRPEPAAVEILIGFSIALVAAENGWLLAGRDRAIAVACVAALLAATVASAFGLGLLAWQAWLGAALFSACHFGWLSIEERPARLRAAVAFAFGLLHGFGFAGALMEIE